MIDWTPEKLQRIIDAANSAEGEWHRLRLLMTNPPNGSEAKHREFIWARAVAREVEQIVVDEVINKAAP